MTEPSETPIAESYEDLAAERNRPRTPHHALFMAVRAGEMTPEQADEKCLADGLPLRHDGWQELHDITTNSVWWLPLAALFYAWRDLTHTREQWERYTAWGHDLWRDSADDRQIMSLKEGEAMLLSDLSSGIVRAFGRKTDGVNVEQFIRPIPFDTWDSLIMGHDRDFSAKTSTGLPAYQGVFVLRHEVVPLLISEIASSTVSTAEEALRDRPSQTTTKNAGGRVLAEHWHDMWAEVCRIVHEEGVPADRLTIVKRMQQWFVDQGHPEPSPQKLNPVLDRLFKALGR